MAIPRHLGCMVKMIFGFAVLLLMGYFALIALNPKAREWATKGAKDGSGGPTPFNAVNQVLAIPAQAIGKTKDVVAAGDARVGVLDGVIAGQEGKSQRKSTAPVTDPFATPAPAAGTSPARAAAANAEAEGGDKDAVSKAAIIAMMEKLGRTQPGAVPPAEPGEAPAPETPPPTAAPVPPPEPLAPAQVKLAGGIIISSVAAEGAPIVRASFFYWVVNQDIKGVFQSPPHRIMLHNRLVYAGDEINRTLGITFDHLDPADKLIVFRDRSGALVTRSY
ncbi:MAG: hypothetical protein HYV75_05230 [Opitutae bacterium]|nr:hypothetical protein [Opitutae bacterium]